MTQSSSPSPARLAAHRVLLAVREGGFASDLLRSVSSKLSSKDAGLAGQIVFGCLRLQGQLDFLIQFYSGRRIADLEPAVLLLLRQAIFQMRYLDRIPPHAAVNDAVEIAKSRSTAAGRFVNAILRKVRRTPVRWPNRSVELSCPEWLLERWKTHFGEATALAIARAALEEPRKYVRVPADGVLEPTDQLAMDEGQLEPTDVEGCYLAKGMDVGSFRLQDIGAQSVVPLLELGKGHSFLDLCCAPGHKLLQALEKDVFAVGCDVSFRRLKESPEIQSLRLVVADASGQLPFTRQFDRVLIDAPCSGTGTLSRNPEIKWRVQPEDFSRFQAQQVLILRNALQLVKPGGRLVYATCSLEFEENEAVVRNALVGYTGTKLAKELWRIPGRDPGDGFYAAAIEKSTF